MKRLPQMVSMELNPSEAKEAMACPSPALPLYPYGLCISLTQEELEKLDVDYSDWSVGDMFHLHALAKITNINQSETTEGNRCRVEMQIIALTGEDEDEENEEYEEYGALKPLG